MGDPDVPFDYTDYEEARHNLISLVHRSLTKLDKDFLISFENGEPDWNKCCAGDLSSYPPVKWKMLNIVKLKEDNPQKHRQGIEKLRAVCRTLLAANIPQSTFSI